MFSFKSFTVLLAAAGAAFAAPIAQQASVATTDLVETRQTSTAPNDLPGSWPFEIVNKWRAIYGLSQLKYSETNHQNAIKTVTDCGAAYYQHELNPGSYGQVLAFGYKTPIAGQNTDNMTPFEVTLLGGWLCERSSAPELQGQCGLWNSIAHMYMIPGDYGHVDIIMNPAYTSVGCGFYQDPSKPADDPLNGMWGCDFGYE